LLRQVQLVCWERQMLCVPKKENIMKTFQFIAAAAAAAIAGTCTVTAEEHRELGPHEHGHGWLNIAIEGKRLSMELEVPGADIVGFEHEASTSEQKTAVEKAKATLADGLSIFRLPAAAGCKLVDAKVTIQAENEHDHADAEHKDQAKHEGGEEHHHHSEFHVTYALDCATPAQITGIDFKYFDAFAGAQELDINLVTEKGQSHYEVTRAQPALKFGEMG
jgi:hypothetical protein